ncbi:hypothetical protein Zmor_012524 [Zophobas morio]|uniref:Nose resistant-to-fluoxetine protein N-terminal domain-containing protein n=1 Tax=Zophobas morio TaxID=2755281 RepID=A0AA38IG86_9CUCU|nr:hypothetical protein Zmor_012524 [Zophobas morio]
MKSLLFVVVGILTVHCDIDKFAKNRTNYPRPAGNTSVPFRWDDFSIERTLLSAEQTGKLCLKNVDKCIEQDLNYESTANGLSSFLLGTQPPFDLSQVPGVSPLCKKQSEKYIEDLKRFKLWALKMYDSTAKLPSGLLNGNLNQLGDFDMCLQSKEKNEEISGQYCLASMQVEAGNSSPYILALHRLMHSHFHFKSELEDPGHRIPRFSSINWALCIPNACTPRDVELGLTTTVEQIVKNTDLRFKVLVRPEMCHKSHRSPVPTSTITAICVFAGIVGLVVLGTVYDYFTEGTKHRNEWILAFSLLKNAMTLTTIQKSGDDLAAIHGIRFFNAIFLVLAHKSMAVFFAAYVNRTEMVEVSSA